MNQRQKQFNEESKKTFNKKIFFNNFHSLRIFFLKIFVSLIRTWNILFTKHSTRTKRSRRASSFFNFKAKEIIFSTKIKNQENDRDSL